MATGSCKGQSKAPGMERQLELQQKLLMIASEQKAFAKVGIGHFVVS